MSTRVVCHCASLGATANNVFGYEYNNMVRFVVNMCHVEGNISFGVFVYIHGTFDYTLWIMLVS